MPDDEIQRRTKIANSISRSDSHVTVMEVGVGPLSIESSIEEFMAVGPMLKSLREIGEENKYDAIIIGCAGDPGLRPARELLDIPVIGPAESSYHFACMVSDRFSILSTLQAGKESDDATRAHLREKGLEARLASVEFAKLGVTDLWGGNPEVITKFVIDASKSAKSKGAGSLVLGCMSMAFLMVDDIVRSSGLPVINPLKTAIKTAEMFIDLKARHSRVTYPAADIDKLRKTVFSE